MDGISTGRSKRMNTNTSKYFQHRLSHPGQIFPHTVHVQIVDVFRKEWELRTRIYTQDRNIGRAE